MFACLLRSHLCGVAKWQQLVLRDCPARRLKQYYGSHQVANCGPSPSTARPSCGKCIPLEEGSCIDPARPAPFTAPLVDILQLPQRWSIPRLTSFRRWLADVRYSLQRLTGNHLYPDITPAVLSSRRYACSSSLLPLFAALPLFSHSLPTNRSSRVKSGIERWLDEEDLSGSERDRTKQRLEANARSYVAGMAASISALVIRMTAYVLLKVLRRFLGGILVSEEQIQMIRECQAGRAKKVPIVYLPLHRSHLDYILLTYILWHYDIRVPHVASGDNLNFSCFGWLLRGLGAFFIRRRLDKGMPEGKRDFVYRSVLHAYMEELLRAGEPVEFFMEGTRSRLGKTLMPKAGLLSVIVETLLNGGMEDAILVPVSYSYERVLDQGFVEELLGREKKRESLWGIWASIWSALGQHYGRVRVDFGRPTSLKRLTHSIHDLIEDGALEPITMPGNGLASSASGSFGSRGALSKRDQLGSSLLSGNEGDLERERRLLVNAVAHHCLHDATNNAAVTGTQLVACLLAGKYGQGAWLRELLVDFAWLSGEARLRGAELLGGYGSGEGALEGLEDSSYFGAPGAAGCDELRAFQAVREAVGLLGPEIVSAEASSPEAAEWAEGALEWTERLETDSGIGGSSVVSDGTAPDERLFVRPLSTPLASCLLSYYKNGAMHIFALDGVLASAFLSFDSSRDVDYAAFLARAESLAELLGNQFLFTKPCERLRSVLERRLATRFSSPRARILQRRRSGESGWARRKSGQDDSLPAGALPPIWELGSEEEEEEKDATGPDCLRVAEFDELYSLRVLRFYAALMEPYIQKLGSHSSNARIGHTTFFSSFCSRL